MKDLPVQLRTEAQAHVSRVLYQDYIFFYSLHNRNTSRYRAAAENHVTHVRRTIAKGSQVYISISMHIPSHLERVNDALRSCRSRFLSLEFFLLRDKTFKQLHTVTEARAHI